jgi:nitrite reductase (NADH) small subunit
MTAQEVWIDVGRVDDVPRLGAKVVVTSRGNIAIFRTGSDEIFALDDRCPHKGGHLSQGIVHGRHVTCPLHSWAIALDTGEALAPDVGCTRSIPVRVQNGRIAIAQVTEVAA